MKYCIRCGREANDEMIFCPSCGSDRWSARRQENGGPRVDFNFNSSPAREKGSVWITVLSAAFWLLGLFFYMIWRRTKPGLAYSAIKGALINVCFGFPFMGLFIWIFYRGVDRPLAKACGIAAIVGAGVNMIISIVVSIVSIMNGTVPLPDGGLNFAAFVFSKLFF